MIYKQSNTLPIALIGFFSHYFVHLLFNNMETEYVSTKIEHVFPKKFIFFFYVGLSLKLNAFIIFGCAGSLMR